jgi:hypothetical protein
MCFFIPVHPSTLSYIFDALLKSLDAAEKVEEWLIIVVVCGCGLQEKWWVLGASNNAQARPLHPPCDRIAGTLNQSSNG